MTFFAICWPFRSWLQSADLPAIPQARHFQVCGVVDKGRDGGMEVVVAGGSAYHGEGNDNISLTLDILNFNSMTWRTVGEQNGGRVNTTLHLNPSAVPTFPAVESLPFNLTAASSVPYGNTFLVVGGFMGEGSMGEGGSKNLSRYIFKYDTNTESFVLLSGHLSNGRAYATAFFIDPDTLCKTKTKQKKNHVVITSVSIVLGLLMIVAIMATLVRVSRRNRRSKRQLLIRTASS